MKIQFTTGYRPHFNQISRISELLLENDKMEILTKQEIAKELGLSSAQTSSILNVMGGFGLVETKSNQLTCLGKIIASSDKYFERIHTLWIIHYLISSKKEISVWYKIINTIITENDIISAKETVVPYFLSLENSFSEHTIKNRIRQETGSVLWSYTHSNLARLNILIQKDTGYYLRGQPITPSPYAFIYCILEYREMLNSSATAFSVKEILGADDSPGKVMFVSESNSHKLISDLHDIGFLRLERFGDLDQLRLSEGLTKYKVLQRIYEA
jgi:hypothetical protein